MLNLAEEAIEQQVSSVTLKVNRANEPAIRFYRRLGFNVVTDGPNNLAMSAEPHRIIDSTASAEDTLRSVAC